MVLFRELAKGRTGGTMKRHRINVPNGSLTNEDIEMIIGKIAMCGYAVQKRKYTSGDYKGVRYIEYWVEDDTRNVE